MSQLRAGRPVAKILSSTEVYKGAVFGVRRDEVLEPSGVRAIREVITHPGSVVVLPVRSDGRIVLVRRFRVFLDVFPTPGFLEERMYILLAEGLTAGEAQPEEDEKITAKAFTLAQLDNMIRQGKLRDAKSIAGLLYYFRYLA
jgi:ADP-ribose pyrophosphatase